MNKEAAQQPPFTCGRRSFQKKKRGAADWGIASTLERNQTAHGRIREAVLSGFDVTRKPVLGRRIAGNRDNQVVPAVELLLLGLIFQRPIMLQKPGSRIAAIGIQDTNCGLPSGNVGDF